jgi:hypothetical protein
MAYGQRVFGLRDVKLTDTSGSPQVDLPVARTLQITERVTSGELKGDDVTRAVVTFSDAVEFSLEEGGISLEAYALMTGRTATVSGTTPTRINTLSADAPEAFPYFKIYGKALGDEDPQDDVHVKLGKCKLTSALEGSFADGEFWVTACSGVCIADEDNGDLIMDIVQNETATTLPAT